jgi:hypothetical protein
MEVNNTIIEQVQTPYEELNSEVTSRIKSAEYTYDKSMFKQFLID